MIKKVAIDSGPLTSGHSVRGIGVYTRELISTFEKLKPDDFVFEKGRIKVEAVDFSKNDLSSFDLLHYQHFNPFLKLSFEKKTRPKIIFTIHDLIPLIYPKNYPPGIKGRLNFFLNKAKLKDVDRVITISKTSKKDIVKFLSYPEEKIDVIYLAPRDIFRNLKEGNWKKEIIYRYKLPKIFALYVGDVNYNKNISTLLKACKELDLPLFIAGKQAYDLENHKSRENMGVRDWIRFLFNKPHPETAHFEELIKLFSQSNKIVRLGFVPDSDLVAIYNLASVYIQPSFYEGFGLPLLEAMSCGTPVLASSILTHREVAENSALFFDPQSVSDLKEKLEMILSDKKLRENLINKGFERVKDFSWIKTAKNTLKVYEKILF
jgi:glycosyltransferase involved in cell wall biosynthesis